MSCGPRDRKAGKGPTGGDAGPSAVGGGRWPVQALVRREPEEPGKGFLELTLPDPAGEETLVPHSFRNLPSSDCFALWLERWPLEMSPMISTAKGAFVPSRSTDKRQLGVTSSVWSACYRGHFHSVCPSFQNAFSSLFYLHLLHLLELVGGFFTLNGPEAFLLALPQLFRKLLVINEWPRELTQQQKCLLTKYFPLCSLEPLLTGPWDPTSITSC